MMEARAGAVFVGLTTLDVLGRTIDSIPEGGAVQFIDEIRLTVAGTAGGTAVDCAKLGVPTTLVSAVGTDDKAKFLLQMLKEHHVNTSLMQELRGVPTSATILTIRSNGERPASHQKGSSDHLFVTQEHFEALFALRPKFLHFGGTGLLAKMDGEPTVELLRAAKEQGCTTTFDLIAPNENTLNLLLPCLPFIDYFMPSIEEASYISGIQAESYQDIGRFFLQRGATTCIFKCGWNGSFVISNNSAFKLEEGQRIPAFNINAVDTTGCGDAYCAGFIAGLDRGWSITEACRFGTAASALVATGLGSDAGIIDFQQTFNFMNTTESLT